MTTETQQPNPQETSNDQEQLQVGSIYFTFDETTMQLANYGAPSNAVNRKYNNIITNPDAGGNVGVLPGILLRCTKLNKDEAFFEPTNSQDLKLKMLAQEAIEQLTSLEQAKCSIERLSKIDELGVIINAAESIQGAKEFKSDTDQGLVAQYRAISIALGTIADYINHADIKFHQSPQN